MIFSRLALYGSLLCLLPALTSGYSLGKADVVPMHKPHENYIDTDNDSNAVARRIRKPKRAFSISPEGSKGRFPWPNGIVKYQYANLAAQLALQKKLGTAKEHWVAAAPYLEFQNIQLGQDYDDERLWVDIAAPGTASSCGVGSCKGCGKDKKVQMWLDPTAPVGTFVHEFGHALGLKHEHQRPDRNQYMKFDCTALRDYKWYGPGDDEKCSGDAPKCCKAGTCKYTACQDALADAPECCKDDTCRYMACQYAVLDEPDWNFDWSGTLDLKSVMMYTMHAGGVRDRPVLVGIEPHIVLDERSEGPSKGDKLRICDLYKEQCKRQTAVCGNGKVEYPEECDDGNTKDGDGCSSKCEIEETPPATAVCGNGKVEYPEECDDGNTKDGDGCSSKCTIEKIPPGQTCEVCSPSPIENKCDITTSCITSNPDGRHYCACRAGYKANPGYNTADLVEWRLPFVGQEYRVFVKPGVICDTLCEAWATGGKDGVICGEVPTKNDCK